MKKVLLVVTMGLGISNATLPFSLGNTLGTCRNSVTSGATKCAYKVLDGVEFPLDKVQSYCKSKTTHISPATKHSALNTALIYAFIAKDGKSFFDRFQKAISQKTPMFSFECRSLVAEVTMKALLYSMARPEKCVVKSTLHGANKHDWFKTVAYIALAQLIDADVYKKVEDGVKSAFGKGYDAYGFVHDKIVK